jgi:hypothetical protein
MGSILMSCRGPVLAALVASLPALGATLMPNEGAPMLVYAPFAAGGAPGVMARADARLVRAMPRADVLIVSSSEPGLASRLYGAGASLVLSSRQLQGCSP